MPFREHSAALEVLVGTNQWRFGGKRYKLDVTIIHEQYGWPGKDSNDIALIRVKEQFEFNEKVQPIKYSREEVPVHSANLKFFGWGWGKSSAETLDGVKKIVNIKEILHFRNKRINKYFNIRNEEFT